MVYGQQPADQVYAVTKAMITGYDAYKDAAAGAIGLAADRQTKKWVVPVHPGAVKALKEAGQWSDDQEAHNNALLKRQAVLAAAWADFGKASPPSDDKEFLDGWMKARAAALKRPACRTGLRINLSSLPLTQLQRRRDNAPAHFDGIMHVRLNVRRFRRTGANGSSSTIRMAASPTCRRPKSRGCEPCAAAGAGR